MKVKISVFFLLTIFVVLIFSPTIYNNTSASDYTNKSNPWKIEDMIEFVFEKEEGSEININIFFTINEDFDQYSNFFLFVQLINQDSNEKLSVDTLEYEIYNKYGDCLGSGLSNLKQFQKTYKPKTSYLKSGFYKLEITQGMRETIQGVSNVGFKIIKDS